jgi:hypothetical protein
MELFHCDESGWGTNNHRKFDAHVLEQHEGKPWRAWRVYVARFFLIVAVLVIIIVMIMHARGR